MMEKWQWKSLYRVGRGKGAIKLIGYNEPNPDNNKNEVQLNDFSFFEK